MITFSTLGYCGRFGNQMFQYAALVGLASIAQTSWGVPRANHQVTRRGSLGHPERFVLPDCFNLAYQFAELDTIKFRFGDNGKLVKLSDHTDIIGFFQSEKFFAHVEASIREQFTFRPEILNVAKQRVAEVRRENDLVSIHVRRGDYLKLSQQHPLCDMAYFRRAMDSFPGADFLVFSDDLAWCRSQFPAHCSFSDGASMFEDMAMMSLCDHHIIANSSFSWWGSYLGGGSVVAPRTWLGPEADTENWTQIYREGWTLL